MTCLRLQRQLEDILFFRVMIQFLILSLKHFRDFYRLRIFRRYLQNFRSLSSVKGTGWCKKAKPLSKEPLVDKKSSGIFEKELGYDENTIGTVGEL
jgi:hypothetical protein